MIDLVLRVDYTYAHKARMSSVFTYHDCFEGNKFRVYLLWWVYALTINTKFLEIS